MSTGVIFILGKGVTPILAYGVKSTWPQGSSAPGFSTVSGRHNFDGCMNPYYGFGIVTTGLHPTDLTREEENLYNLIVKRVLEAFTPGRTLRNRKDKELRRRRGQNRRRKYSAKTV